jgi:hypothetical protein
MFTVIPDSDRRRRVALPRGLCRGEGPGGDLRQPDGLERDSSTIREAHRRGAVVALPISFNSETHSTRSRRPGRARLSDAAWPAAA